MKKAFTLVEFLIYFSLVFIILSTMGTISFNIFKEQARLKAAESIKQSALSAMEKITTGIMNSTAINELAPGSFVIASAGSNDKTFSLKMADPTKDPTIIELSNGIIKIKEGNSPSQNVTGNDVVVTDLELQNVSYPETPGTIRMKLTLKSSGLEKEFYATANIRKK